MRLEPAALALSSTLLLGGTLTAQNPGDRLRRAVRSIDALIKAEMRNSRAPGVALALTDRRGVLHLATYGFADAKTRTPVTQATLFEIGSIGKSFTAVALLQLRDQGRIDPRRPVKDYLPWFDIQSGFAPIQVHHLLSHTAGIPSDRDDIPSGPYRVIGAKDLVTGSPPGTRFSYSNLGYQILGYVVEEVAKLPYGQVIRQRILEPLGMTRSEPVLTNAIRPRVAIPYVPLFDDRPDHRSRPLVEARWFEYGDGDGSIATTAADLAAYVRMILNRGMGPKGRILTEEGFNLLTHPVVPVGDGRFYGYGLYRSESEGRRMLSHSGAMIGHRSYIAADMDDGLGVVVLVNGPLRLGGIGEFALRVVRAARRAETLPPRPRSTPDSTIPNATEYAGSYQSPDARQLRFSAQADRLTLAAADGPVTLERRGPDRFIAPRRDFDQFLFEFGRDSSGSVVEVLHGSDWFVNERYRGPRGFDPPPSWRTHPGHYRTENAWFTNFRVVLRKGKLWVIRPGGDVDELVPLDRGASLFRVGSDSLSPDRVRFGMVVGSRTLNVNYTGVDFYRSFDPPNHR